jgi:DNA-binding transcriptional ArsR family regulator
MDSAASEAFAAIASPVRRQILDLLAEGDRPVNDIASGFAMSRPAISQHLRILLAAGLVAETRHGRENLYSLMPAPLAPVRDWIRHYERFWDDHLGRLQKVLEKSAVKKNRTANKSKGGVA